MKCSDCHKPIRPVVAIDIDGTLADYHFHFIQFANTYLNMNKVAGYYDGSVDLATFFGISKETYRQIKLAYRQGGMKRSMPVYGWAAAMMAKASEVAEVWVTTTRPYMRLDNVDPDTRFWLSRNQIKYDHLLYDEDKYAKLIDMVGAGRIVFVLDDMPDLYDRAHYLGLNVFLRKTAYNRAHTRLHQTGSLLHGLDLINSAVKQWEEHNA